MLHSEFNVDEVYAAIDIHLSTHSHRLCRDRDDLRQDIILTVMERSQEYDPTLASLATFLDRHIRLSINEFFLKRRWLKNKTPESLEEINEFEPDRQPRLNDVHSWELNFQENAVLAAEVQEVIDTMPEQLRDVAEYLKHYSLAETADMMDIPPNVLRRDIKKLQKIFTKAKIRPDHFEDV